MRTVVLFLLGLPFWNSLLADNIEAELAAQVQNEGIPAMATVVFDGKRILKQAQAGVREHGGRAEVEEGDLWHIGSNGKAITATLVGRLVDRGLVSWETTLGEIFAKEEDEFHPDSKKITVAHLLGHTAGLPANVDRVLFRKAQEAEGRRIEKQRLEIVETTLKNAPLSEPGAKYLYSNTGYVIAGAVVERLLKKSWETAVEEEVFEPLGMKSVGFGAPEGRTPRGHTRGGRELEPAGTGYDGDNPAIYGPAGGMHLTLEDWVRFAQAHLNQDQFLKPETYARLHQPGLGNYSLGWLARANGGEVVRLGHDGSNTMWYARISLDLQAKTGVCLVTNVGGETASAAISKVEKVAMGNQ